MRAKKTYGYSSKWQNRKNQRFFLVNPLQVLFCLFILLGIKKQLFSQHYIYSHYTTADGLPTNEIYNSYCDKNGFIWFGSNRGLIKFDGKKFTTFDSKDGLPDNDVLGIIEDYNGRMWLNTFKGKLCYYHNGVFHTEKNTPFLKTNFSLSTFHSIILNNDSSLTITDQSNYGKFIEIKGENIQLKEFKFNRIKAPPITISTPISGQVYKIKDGYVLENGYTKIYADFNLECSRIEYLNKHLVGQCPNHFYLSNIGLEDKNGEILIPRKNLDLSNSPTINIKKIILLDSIFVINTSDNSLIYNKKNKAIDTLLDMNVMGYILKDRDHNIWISTLNAGIFKFPKNFLNCHRHRSSFKKNTDIFELNNIIMAGTELGEIHQITAQNINCAAKVPYPSINNFFEPCRYISQNKSLYALTSTDVIKYDHNLNIDRSENVHFEKDHIYTQKFRILNHHIYRFVSTWYFKNPINNTTTQKNKYRKLPSKINDVSNDSTNIYLALRTGLYQNFGDTFLKLNKIGDSVFQKIAVIKSKLVAINLNGDLSVIDNFKAKPLSTTLHFKNLKFENILFSNDSICMLSATNGCILLKINNKLFNKTTDIFLVKEYLGTSDIYRAYQTSSSTYFLRKDDILIINNDQLLELEKVPTPVFDYAKTELRKFYKDGFSIPLNNASNVEIFFSCLQTHYKNIYFQYATIVNGDTSSWFETNQNSIPFNNPSYGKYKVLLRSVNLLDQASLPLVIEFEIQTPFYATIWFILICVLSLAIIGRIIYLYNLRSSIKKQEDQHQQEIRIRQSEFKALNALINPHFVFNSLNNIQSLVNTDEKTNANRYLSIFSNLMRQNMYNVDSGMISLQKELNLIENYIEMEKLRHGDFFDFVIHIQEQVDAEIIQIPPLTIQPIIENAILHGLTPIKNQRRGKIEINVFEKNKTLTIEIIDNGVGNLYIKESENKSYGLSNIRERLEHISFIHEKEFTVGLVHYESGTTVTILVREK